MNGSDELSRLRRDLAICGAECERRDNTMAELLDRIGDRSKCEQCGRPIVWVVYRSLRQAAHDPNGILHTATCPNANLLRRTDVIK